MLRDGITASLCAKIEAQLTERIDELDRGILRAACNDNLSRDTIGFRPL